MKLPEEINIEGGKLLRTDTWPLDEPRYATYKLIPDPPMPELKPGMWAESKGCKHLVVEVQENKVYYYSPFVMNVWWSLMSEITAVYDRNEQEVWRR